MSETGIGASVRRKEDRRFLTGNGNYLDDINKEGQTYAHFVRSPHAHATIKSIDTSEAEASKGVVAVLTGQQLADDGIGGLICGWVIHSKDGEPHKAPAHPALAIDKVRYVGDQVAVVVAESAAQAKDAAEKMHIDYDVLPAAAVTRTAADVSAPQVHDDAPGNICYDWEIGDKAATDDAFANAHHVTKLELLNNRLIPNAMEPRAALAEYNAGDENLTLHTTSQNPHVARLVLSAFNQIAPSINCELSLLTLVEDSALRSLFMRRKQSASGRLVRLIVPSNGMRSAQNPSKPMRMAVTMSRRLNWR